MDTIELGIFVSRMEAVCDEMGAVLQRAAFSPNIKDRLDYSCAVFDHQGALCAQAAHIPVHLGSMAYAMADLVSAHQWRPGDMMVVNDPYMGGTHLPDVTVIAPIFAESELIAFVVNRAHHANIGAHSPGSMPISNSLEQEGIVISPTLIQEQDEVAYGVLASMCGLDKDERAALEKGQLPDNTGFGDFMAQISANRVGQTRLQELLESFSIPAFQEGLVALNQYSERLARSYYGKIPDGDYTFADVMDSDGQGTEAISLKVAIAVQGSDITVDFTGTQNQVAGNINCPISVAAAAVYYVFRCLLPESAPASAGCFKPITVTAPLGSLLNAKRPAAVAAGNVETSTRVVDLVLGALAQAIPDQIPAASQGSMNNLAMGHLGGEQWPRWDYYETMAGGMGASSVAAGLHGVHSHMTNTLNTPIESLEMHYPLRVLRYELRTGSGGKGLNAGGDGLIKEIEFLAPAEVTLLTERRVSQPYGLSGGLPGNAGENLLNDKPLAAKQAFPAEPGDRLTIATPGGGGWGNQPVVASEDNEKH